MTIGVSGRGSAPATIGRPWRAFRGTSAFLATGAFAVVAGAVTAQEAREPNPLLTFSLSQGVSVERNPGLDPGEDSVGVALTSNAGLTFLSETPISSLTVSGRASLRVPLPLEDADLGDVFDGPRLSFAYDRAVPSSSLSLSGSLDTGSVTFLRSLEDFVNDDGTIDLPDDFEDLVGEGRRRNISLDAGLTLRDDRPFGIEFAAGFDRVDYTDVTSPDLVDSQTTRVSTTLRFDLTEVAQIRTTLRARRFEEDGSEATTATGLDVTGRLDRPLGPLSASLSLDRRDEGIRTSVRLGRTLEQPLGTYSGQIGVTRDSDGDFGLVGDLAIRRALPDGSISLTFQQGLTSNSAGEEESATTLSANYNRAITPLIGIGADVIYSDFRELDTDERVRNLQIGTFLSRTLTPEWSLVAGYRVRFRQETGEDRSTGDSLYLTLNRVTRRGL